MSFRKRNLFERIKAREKREKERQEFFQAIGKKMKTFHMETTGSKQVDEEVKRHQ